ncbi:uncharacterized protein K460DRAFT_176037 [Cucurbitaria berberidis CBS 394.84]|uniref:Uncharacterized protein n=1 Tax=Cucurbitaria berberidis CBS 394.84 TaxID=1168544 RepID=A0A9P4GA13_9PLEO|nr:uncharacterized protein K460DRAFT_176037 [Cucurbitaria berberidis CBS 394.84]KAF1841938.1 hypothetical protein K460DRAFT_176037 [Cucurbitaria berberidis CBS 394.84]
MFKGPIETCTTIASSVSTQSGAANVVSISLAVEGIHNAGHQQATNSSPSSRETLVEQCNLNPRQASCLVQLTQKNSGNKKRTTVPPIFSPPISSHQHTRAFHAHRKIS